MTTSLRIGTDDFLLVRWSDIVRIRDRNHAEHLLEHQRDLLADDLHSLLDQLAAGDLMLVRTDNPRPVLLVPSCDSAEPIAAIPSPSPTPRPPTWLAIEVRHESGVGYPRASLVLELPDGTERFEQLDDDSRFRADDILPAGSCRVWFEPPLRLPPAAQRGEPRALVHGTAPPITLQDRGTTPTRLPTAATHLLLVPKTTVHAARIGDVYFGTARAVVLPARPEGRHWREPTPLEAVADAIAHVAASDPRPFALVAGHADTVGTDATNDTLLPDLTHPTPGYDVYGSQRYRIMPVPPRPRFRLVRYQVLDCRWDPMPYTEYELVDVEGAHAGTTDAEGFTRRFLMIEGKEDDIRISVCGLEYQLLLDFELKSCAIPVCTTPPNVRCWT